MPLPPSNNSNKKAGSGFTNLNRYLQANQANRLGQTVSAGVQRVGGDARSALTQANQDFQAKASEEQSRLAQQGTKVNNVLGNVVNASDDDVKTFENIRNAESRGPMGVADANSLRAKAGEAESLGRAGGTDAGRFGLLQRFVGRGNSNYNAGNQRLDQMLLGQTGQQQLRGARASTVGLSNQAEQGIAGAAARGDELKGQARQLADSTIGKLGEQTTAYDAAMQQKLADKKANINAIIGGVETGGNNAVELDDNLLKYLKEASGGVLDEGTTLYNADLSPYLNMNELYATKQGAQSAEDFAKLKKLGALTGNSLAGKDQGAILQDYLGRADMAGSFDANNPFAVTSATDLSKAINKAKSQYESEMATKNAQIRDNENTIRDHNTSLAGNYFNSDDYNKLVASNPGLYDPLRTTNIEQSQGLVNDWAKQLMDKGAPTPEMDPTMYQTALYNRLKPILEGRTAAEQGKKDREAERAALDPKFNTLRKLKKKTPVV